ncbi:MAG: Spy/CpxP family protein refolding chaperone [Rhodoblastus sp.]
MTRLLAPALLSLACLIGAGAQAETAKSAQSSSGRGARMIERLCGALKPQQAWDRYAERLSERLSLDEKQKGLLKTWQEARIAAREESRKVICGQKPDFSNFQGRLDYRQKRLETQLANFKATRAPLEAFYASLSDKQKTSWDEMREKRSEKRRNRRSN